MALAATPVDLGYRIPSEKAESIGEREDRRDALVGRADAVRSRLVLEIDPKADEVLGALVGVVNAAKLYEMEAEGAHDHSDRYPAGEIAKLRDETRQAYLRLGVLCREHLEALEKIPTMPR